MKRRIMKMKINQVNLKMREKRMSFLKCAKTNIKKKVRKKNMKMRV